MRGNVPWPDRLVAEQKNWAAIFNDLVTTYMHWEHNVYPPTEVPVHDPTLDATINILDLYTLERTSTIHRSQTSTSIALDLARDGYMSSTPVSPSYAMSFKTLELFHRLRLRKPSFSAEAFTKVICDLYTVCRIINSLFYTHKFLLDPVSPHVSDGLIKCI